MKANKYITLLASAALMTACDLDKFPEAGVITEDQKNEVIADDPGKIAGDLNALKNIVLNSLRDAGAGFGVDTNKVTLIDRAGREELPLLSKADTAEKIADKIESILK